MRLTEDIDHIIAKALKLYSGGKFLQAAEHFAAALARAPDHAVALRLRGLALVRSGEVAQALPLLARARRLAPNDPLVFLHYGIGLREAGQLARAAAMFRRAIGMSPKDPVPWINFSSTILALGHPQAARAAARRALAIAPQSAEAHYTLGLAEWRAQNLSGAQLAFSRAVKLAPTFAEAWLNLGLALFQLGRLGDATQATHQALAARPDYGAAEANLAAFTVLQGDHEEALRRLRSVLARDPTCVPARLNLANALLLDREPKEALGVLAGQVPAGREGAHWRAHRAMALLALNRRPEAATELAAIPRPYGDAELSIIWRQLLLADRSGEAETASTLAERLAGLVEHEGSGLIEHRISSCFDLAFFYDKKGRKDRAFNYWQAGHRLLARAQPFSREQFRDFVDTNIRCFDAGRLREGARAASSGDAAIFVVGLPRSGTTLTEQILAAHPSVFGAGERSALHRTVVNLAGPSQQADTIRRFTALDETTLTAAGDAYLSELRALAPDARFVVDKMPGNALHLGAIATLLPGARIIYCRRDPRDIGLSIFQFRFFGYHPYAHDLADLGWYIGEHERLMEHWVSVLPLPICQVALADWVNDFSGTLRRLLDFLGLPYASACERFYEQKRRVRTASVDQVRRPINARGLGRWKGYATQLAPMLTELVDAGLIAADETTPNR